ncbi:hypothetical protein GE061_006620 [Apolygus lucorum]|uniref:Uncharacterized protein n=1 Tax=Apolygus lucorum TaxID=248454 RepID=A0A6A4J0N8_APOLU|nr:hypothetical protein GE061_006620 [Apolygus lucorum]
MSVKLSGIPKPEKLEESYSFAQFNDWGRRKNNLLLRGLRVLRDDDLFDVVHKFFSEILRIQERIDVEFVRRISTSKTAGGDLLLVSLQRSRDKWNIIGKAKVLNGTNYSISQDFPPTMRNRRSKLLRLRAEIRKTKPGIVCHVRTDKLVVDNKLFFWDDEDGLLARDGTTNIKNIAGIDLSAVNQKLLSEGQADVGGGAAI